MKGQEQQQEERKDSCCGKRYGTGEVEGIEAMPGSQKGFGCIYALPTHKLHTNVRCGMHQSSLAVVSTYHTTSAPESQGMGYAKHNTVGPYKQEKDLDIMCNAEVVGTCTPLLARDT